MLKRNKYIILYLIFMIVLCILNVLSVADTLSIKLPLPIISNPLLFLVFNIFFIYFIMKRIGHEKYSIYIKNMSYFKSINNLVIFIMMYYASFNLLSSLVDLIITIVLMNIFDPMLPNPELINSYEEYFREHPERNKERMYKDIAEISSDYNEELNDFDPRSGGEKTGRIKFIISCIIVLVGIILIVGGIIINSLNKGLL